MCWAFGAQTLEITLLLSSASQLRSILRVPSAARNKKSVVRKIVRAGVASPDYGQHNLDIDAQSALKAFVNTSAIWEEVTETWHSRNRENRVS